jgi:hypothetical protein
VTTTRKKNKQKKDLKSKKVAISQPSSLFIYYSENIII